MPSIASEQSSVEFMLVIKITDSKEDKRETGVAKTEKTELRIDSLLVQSFKVLGEI